MYEDLEKKFRSNQWILSPWVRVVTGYNNTVIYDFKRKRAYQVSKFAGNFLEKVFTNKKTNKRASELEEWIEKERDRLSNQVFDELCDFVDKLERVRVLISFSEFPREKVTISELQIGSSIPDIPALCLLEITSHCNFHCPHCYLGPKDAPKDLDFDTVCRILSQIKEMGIPSIHLTGGEICLRKDLGDIITFAHDLGLEIHMATNGSELSEEVMESIEKCVKKMQITLYALTKETYSKFSDDSLVQNKVISAIDELQRRKPEILLVNFIVTPYNYHEIDVFRKFAEERKLEYAFGRTMPIGLALKDEDILAAPWYDSLFEGIALGGTEKESSRKKKKSLFRTHTCPLDRFTVLSNGMVTICPPLRDSSFTFGDIYSHSIKDIWYKKVKPFFSSLHVDNLEICKDCEFKYLCGGECPALWHVLKPLKKTKHLPCQDYFSTMKFLFSKI